MFRFLKKDKKIIAESDFLVKSALGVSIVATLILLPFGINDFFNGRMVSGIFVVCMASLCTLNSWLGWRGNYSLALNLIGIIPVITIAAANAMFNHGDPGSYWSYLAVFAVYFILPFRYAGYANAVFLGVIVASAWFTLSPEAYIRFSSTLIGASFFIFISNREISKTQEQLKKQSTTDALTGTFNRVPLSENLNRAIELHKSEGELATLCVLDIDHFKKINDSYGHDIGDEVLVKLSAFILSMISKKDMLFRIGGEEFLILMNNTNIDEGLKTADAIRALVEDLELVPNHPVTISVGVTEISENCTWKEWMKCSDENLYKAKQNGRNQVVY
jgi:diguanylate cyclase (GGDEF)-like protein